MDTADGMDIIMGGDRGARTDGNDHEEDMSTGEASRARCSIAAPPKPWWRTNGSLFGGLLGRGRPRR